VLSETSELGFDPVADPDQVEREREREVESSHQSSLVINLSFSFTPLLLSSDLQEILRGLLDLLRR